jgi:Tfp pilus assembly protein PilF
LLRARSYFKLGEYNPVIEDTMAILRARKNNIEALYIRAKAFLYLGEIDTALNHLRECIRVDPDYKACTQESKKLRSFQKSLQAAEDAVNGGNGAAALESLKSCLEYDPNWHFIMPKLYILKCKSHNKAKDPKSALEACSKALEYDAGLIEAVIQMGEALLLSEEWDRVRVSPSIHFFTLVSNAFDCFD